MKKIILTLIAATALAAPLAATAQAQQPPHHGPDRHVEKKVVVTKSHWSKGYRMTSADRRRTVEVRDYRSHRLSAPPRGYHWVKVDNDYLLIGITSGIISSIIAAH
ncbi:RcnB family protein [Neorhizobium sp. NCHU2750]|uniref:RcnB family protein n=1 Tax=Neorhizobium sp. NCHU2750 TaxID=1825976 RepID=UPI000E728ACF|nr:membrane protein [Neorhizobium sp. NCHU2750]